MKTSTVLKQAKKYLAKSWPEIDYVSNEQFICMAILQARPHSPIKNHRYYERCADMVEGRLAGKATLESWLAAKGCIPKTWEKVDLATKNRIQQHRYAWLERMIVEFESKGD